MGNNGDEPFLQAATRLGDFQLVIAHQAIYSSVGVKLIDSGVRVDSGLYDRLLNHKLRVPIENCLTAENSVTVDELRDHAERLVAERAFYGQLVADLGDRAILLAAIARIDLPPPIAFRLTVARDCRSAVFEHSVQVMLVALFLGIRQQLAAGKLRALAAAALLHDLGVLHIDPEIFLAGHIFTAAERRQLHAHPLTAGMIVQQQPEYPPTVARAILEHHERHDGSGYPRGLKGDEISVEGRILLLAELVAALLEKNAREPDKQLSVILRLNHSKFDQAMTTQILKLLEQEHAVADEADLQPEQPQAERLKRLAGECDKWRQLRSQLENYTTDAPAIGEFLADRVAVLERSLADAGLHPDQIASVGIGLRDQPAAVSELAMLMHETSWQLKAIVDDVFARFPTLETTDKPGERAICDWLRQLQAGLSAGEGAGPGDAALP